MYAKRIAGAAIAAITLVNGYGVAPVESSTTPMAAPISISDDVAIEATYAANTEFASGSAAAIEATEDKTASSAINGRYVKPGDQTLYGDFVVDWTDFQFVSEVINDDGSTTLSGYLPDSGSWTYTFDNEGKVESSPDVPLNSHDDGLAIGMPIAAQFGEATIDGWVFKAEGSVSYCAAPGTTYVYGDGWDAMILDYRRYSEWKYSVNTDYFACPDRYTLVAYNEDSWVIASENVPEIVATEPESLDGPETEEIDVLVEKLKKAAPMQGISDPKWGSIKWAEKVREETPENGSTYWLESECDNHQFSIEIDDIEGPVGFTNEYMWSAAIVSSDFVTRECVSILYYGDYSISVDSNNSVCVVNAATKETRSFELAGNACMNNATTLLTLSDGKHAKCVTCRPEYIAFMYAIAATA